MTQTIKAEKRRKIERFTVDERKAFRKFVFSFDTKDEATEKVDITLKTLNDLLLRGYASPDTIAKARKAMNDKQAA